MTFVVILQTPCNNCEGLVHCGNSIWTFRLGCFQRTPDKKTANVCTYLQSWRILEEVARKRVYTDREQMQPAQTDKSVETAGVKTTYFVEGQVEKDEVL